MNPLDNYPVIYLSQLKELIPLLCEQKNTCVSIKDTRSQYQFANQNFIDLMGLTSLSAIVNRNDADLCADKQQVKTYREHDHIVIETKKVLTVDEKVVPIYNQQVIKRMQGKIYPLYTQDTPEHPPFVLGIFTPQNKLFKLDWDTVFSVPHNILKELLTAKKYCLKVTWGHIQLSRREIELLIASLKGLQAGEIATLLQLKQNTVESYMVNLKNKFGAGSRRELLDTVIKHQLLQQIFL